MGGPEDFLFRDNLPKEEDYGVTDNKSDDSLDILDQLEKNMFEDETPKETNLTTTVAEESQDNTEQTTDDAVKKEEDDAVNDLLDDLIDEQ